MSQTLGFVAASLTAFAFVPQVLKTWRSRSASDLSTLTLLSQATGLALWIVYGVLIRSTPLVAANSVTLMLTLVLLAFKWTFADAAPVVRPWSRLFAPRAAPSGK